MTTTSDEVKVTSRVKIAHLEENVANLWSVVRSLEAKLGSTPSRFEHHRVPSQSLQPEQSANDRSGDEDTDSDSSNLVAPEPPNHILRLLNNPLFGSYESWSVDPDTHANNVGAHARDALRRILPWREDVQTLTRHSASWLSVYGSLFPIYHNIKTSGEMLSQYDELQKSDADPLALAVLLLTVAMTCQQIPNKDARRVFKSIKDVPSYIKQIIDTVHGEIVMNDSLAGTLEGIETSLLFLRLQLGRAPVKDLWLVSRRVIALAELAGLPRASKIAQDQQDREVVSGGRKPPGSLLPISRQKQKAAVWDSICTIDRISSMLFSLPITTSRQSSPTYKILNGEGRVIPQIFISYLADVASSILELDAMQDQSRTDTFNIVLKIDQELRSLANMTPPSWWKTKWTSLNADAIIQYWHAYFLIRTHLQLALTHNDRQHLPYNYTTCLGASLDLACRYVELRPLLPYGFFAGRIMDIQAFTAVVYLLLASYRTDRQSTAQHTDIAVITHTIDCVLAQWENVGSNPGSEVAGQAAGAVRSLRTLLQRSNASDSQNMTVSIPLVGKIHISRKQSAERIQGRVQAHPSGTMQMDQTQRLWDGNSSAVENLAPDQLQFTTSELELLNNFSYSMEGLDNYAFDENLMNNQWLTFSGLDG